VSLILEALKKLERDKETPDRGFLVMAQMPWVGEGRRLHRLLLAGGLVVVALVVLLGIRLFSRPGAPRQPAAAGPAATAPAAPAPAATLPPALPEPPPPRASGPAVSTAPLPRYLPPAQRPAFPASPRAAAPQAPPSAAPAAAAPAVPPALAPETPAAAARPGELRLEALSEQDGVAVAVINGQLVREGDRIGDATVVRIGAQEVEVDAGGRRRVLRFE
jgi:hypothetical protein